MILSMTGFGQASGSYNNRQITVEIKSLNGKSADIRLKLPTYYKEKDLLVRKKIMDQLLRGKVDATVTVMSDTEDLEYALNTNLLTKYSNEIMSLNESMGLSHGDIMQTVIRIPNIIKPIDEKLSDEEWQFADNLIDKALEQIITFKKVEGESLADDLRDNVNAILDNLNQVPQHEDARLNKLKERMQKNLNEYLGKDNVDQNRYEQEVLHYMERLDINEEKVRLEQHCKYFIEQLESGEGAIGKKLGFIGQEIGREINTMGAKAQYSELQKLVVNMKDHLEKIKEQVANAV